jgi:CO/xanthine dehydrogenase FAD-binding subunit
MRTWLAGYELRPTTTLEDALRTLAAEPGVWVPFAGGTDLMVLMEAGKLPRKKYLSLWNLKELSGVHVKEHEVRLGALATYTDLLSDSTLHAEFPLVCAAARETGAVAIQNRGTVGGNIANASPAADLPPALLVYDAVVSVASMRGERRIPYEHFHKGYKVMDLAADELITAVTLPRGRSGWMQMYRKVGTRRAQAISKVCFSAAASLTQGTIDDLRIALGSVAPTVLRCTRTEQALRGSAQGDEHALRRARKTLEEEIAPIDDLRSNARYRRLVAGNLLEDFVRGAS